MTAGLDRHLTFLRDEIASQPPSASTDSPPVICGRKPQTPNSPPFSPLIHSPIVRSPPPPLRSWMRAVGCFARLLCCLPSGLPENTCWGNYTCWRKPQLGYISRHASRIHVPRLWTQMRVGRQKLSGFIVGAVKEPTNHRHEAIYW